MKSDIRGSHIPYRKFGTFPYFVGYCEHERHWNKEMERLKVRDFSFTEPRGATTFGFKDRAGYHLSIVVVNRRIYRRRPLSEAVGMIAHEATHVIQNMMGIISERNPSDEFQAYMIEDAARWLFEQYRQPKSGASSG